MKIQRMLVIKIHAILACVVLPLALLYFISGALYTFDIKGSIKKQVISVNLSSPFTPDLAQLSVLASATLQQHDLVPPRGDPKITEKKGVYEYRWGDLKHLVVMKSTDNPLQAELTYRQRSPLAQIMRVHRAEAGSWIEIVSFSMAIALITILASGVFLAVGLPKLRRTALIASGIGCLLLLPIFF
ncbi:MAG: PepSY domain-containing protein [Halioglobus sp.]